MTGGLICHIVLELAAHMDVKPRVVCEHMRGTGAVKMLTDRICTFADGSRLVFADTGKATALIGE